MNRTRMIITRHGKLTEAEIQFIVETIFERNPDVYWGYTFLSAVDRYHVVYLCCNGHERPNISLSTIRGLHRCGACVTKSKHDAAEIKRRVLNAWSKSTIFLGKFKFETTLEHIN